ncbi:retrovirus-related Pol polyprotein from transposon 17.6 [Trichonephila clavipes]|nr:retrovirus-related Pol polyprotein from transposon 17.6 [Trichonephila clavipes]
MVLKATANGRRHLALCHDEFCGPRSGICRSGEYLPPLLDQDGSGINRRERNYEKTLLYQNRQGLLAEINAAGALQEILRQIFQWSYMAASTSWFWLRTCDQRCRLVGSSPDVLYRERLMHVKSHVELKFLLMAWEINPLINISSRSRDRIVVSTLRCGRNNPEHENIITVNNYEDFLCDFPVSQDILPPLSEKDFNLSGLDSKMKKRLFQLLISHKSAFARSTVELSAAATEHHRIHLQHSYPIKCPIYKIPFNLRNEFRRQIADLEKAGIISKSKSQYNTLALCVKQKEKWRLVLDFRKLNEITLTQDFAILTLDDILHEISGSNYFSALDMKSAFNQIPLHVRDRHKTDKYEFNRLCFGLKNSPKAFQSIAQEVLGDLLHNGALV